MKAKKMTSIKALERFFENCTKNDVFVAWYITKTHRWYNIQVKIEFTNASKKLAYYHTGDYDEIMNFCSTHCNPDNDIIYGLGCIEELADATINYINSNFVGGKCPEEEGNAQYAVFNDNNIDDSDMMDWFDSREKAEQAAQALANETGIISYVSEVYDGDFGEYEEVEPEE